MENPTTLSSDSKGIHHEFLKGKIPKWYMEASDKRQKELSAHQLVLPEWYKKASATLRTTSKESHTTYRKSLNEVEKVLSGIQDIFEFAEPLLTKAIEEKFKQTLNVREVFFARKYQVGTGPRNDLYGFFVFDKEVDPSLNYVYKSITLLEAALGNFEPDEAKKSSCDDCQIITRFNSDNSDIIATWFAVMEQAVPITPEAFAELCRTLDLGRLYQEHIKAIIQPDDAWERAAVETTLSNNQKHMLTVSAHAAYMQNLTPDTVGVTSGISADAYRMLLQVVGSKADITLDGRAVDYAGLKVLGVDLSGILLIGPDRKNSDRVERCIAYIPDDPAQPLKEYPSSADFMVDLKARLHSSAYRRFFSRFVPQRYQGSFFQALGKLLDPSETYSQNEDYTPLPNQRNLRLLVEETSVQGNLWEYLRQERINKIINDARAVAVPTGDEDKKARLERMESYIRAVESVFNLAAFVVPGLGELMLVVGAAEMMSDVFEGIESFEQGEAREMWQHFSSVALNVASIAAGAKVLPAISLSSVVDGLKPVKMPDGKRLLWKPDLKPYEQKITLPDSTPDELGLHRYDGQEILPLGEKYYSLKKDPYPGKYRIQHPTRPDAYQPEANHNGSGAWNHEVEQPRTWAGPVLMKRLGHSVSDFSDTELAQIRHVSDTDENVLRRVHVESEPPAPLLADTISRFDSYKQVEGFIADMKSDSSLVPAKDHSINQLHVITRYGRWPDTVSIRVIDAQAKTIWEYTNPKGAPDKTRVVQIDDAQIRDGKLLKTLLESLDQSETNVLLGQRSGTALGTLDERIANLRGNIARVAERHKSELFNDHYAARTSSSDSSVNLIKARFTGVPTRVVEDLLAGASSSERQQMAKWDFADAAQTKPIPLRLAEELRWIQREARLSRAYEGLYLDALTGPDAENLVLNSLEKLPGWPNDDLRIEVRDGSIEGELGASIGTEGADGEKKVLVRNGDGRYEARDHQDNHLHGADDLFSALQHALPDKHRNALKLPHVGQGAELKKLIQQHALSRDELRPVLMMEPIKPWFRAPKRWSDGRLGYPLSGRGAGVSQQQARDKERVLRLYPDYTDEQVDGFLELISPRREFYLVNFEAEFEGLRNELRQWESTPSTRVLADGSEVAVQPSDKEAVAQLLERCWQKRTFKYAEDGYELGYGLSLRGRAVGALPALTADFPHVRFLDLSGMELVAAPDGFLDSFPSLMQLELQNNKLRDFPTQVALMPELTYLDVSHNNIMLMEEATDTLADMSRLEYLQLSHNPLAHLPDFSQMTALMEVRLQATGITEWPVGLRDQADLSLVDLRDNQLTSFPEWAVNPSAEHAADINHVLEVTELNGNSLSDRGTEQYADILERIYRDDDQAGLMPVPPDGPGDRGAQGGTLAPSAQRVDRWLREIPRNELGARKAQWELLDREALDREASAGEAGRAVSESEEFFRLLEKLSETAEYKKAYSNLKARVWAVLDAAEENEVLRRELFKAAGEPETCSDRAALVFSQLENKVQIHKGLALAGDHSAGPALLKLAKGLFRLDEVEVVALSDIKERVKAIIRDPDTTKRAKGLQLFLMDQIEVRLSYRVGLRDRLELPGQPSEAAYTGTRYVSPAQLRAAEQHVNSLKDSKAEVDSIARRDFWSEYLRGKYRSRFDLAHEPIYERMEQLDITKETMTSDEYNSQSRALATEIRDADRKLIDLLTPQEILDLEDVDTSV